MNPTIHQLKIWPTYFGIVHDGTKCFEVRNNDRRYQVHDILHLQEWSPGTNEYTGRECFRTIIYVLAGGQFGVEDGYVVLGFDPPAPSVAMHYNALLQFGAWKWATSKERSISEDHLFKRFVEDVDTYCTQRGIPQP